MKRKITICEMIIALVLLIAIGPAWAKHVRKTTFAVLSDPHFYQASLGVEGAAFEDYLAGDRKLLKESEALLDAAIEGIIKQGQVKFVLISGDLTKDGELFNHFFFALKMLKLRKAGIKVFVVPGNHDINNPHAFGYLGNREIPIRSVSAQMFKWIYSGCGYGQAIYQDPNSLSYVAEPAKGLWLIAMDACRYDANLIEGWSAADGRFKPQTMEWIMRMIRLGKERGKQVIGMMHHGLLEHFYGESEVFPEYVVADWQTVSRDFAQAGLNIVFTGHYHANDITNAEFEGGRFLFDIETGSLITYPCSFRIVSVRPGKDMKLGTEFISDIDYDTGGYPFPEYAEINLTERFTGVLNRILIEQYGFAGDEQTLTYAGQLMDAFRAHYVGDEYPAMKTIRLIESYLSQPVESQPFLIGQFLDALWTDLNPGDTSLAIDLATGKELE